VPKKLFFGTHKEQDLVIMFTKSN